MGAPQPVAAPPPPLQSRTGKALKWGVSALLIAALGLGSWQLAEALMDRGKSNDSNQTQTTDGNDKNGKANPVKLIKIQNAQEYVAKGDAQAPEDVGKTYDGDSTTYWRTKSFIDGPTMKPSFKPGVGIVYDLGSQQTVSAASIGLLYPGDHTTISLYATDSMSSSTPVDSMTKIGTMTTSDTTAKITVSKKVKSQYVLLWITAMPHAAGDQYSGAGYKQAITDMKFTG
jgi:hypothetical protein